MADIAEARNIQPSTVLSYLAEAVAAGRAYAWERFGVADSTLRSVGEAAAAFVAEELDPAGNPDGELARADSTCEDSGPLPAPDQPQAASVGVAALCGFAEAPAGPADAVLAAAGSNICPAHAVSRTTLLAATNTLPGASLSPAQALTASQGCAETQCVEQQSWASEEVTDEAKAVSAPCGSLGTEHVQQLDAVPTIVVTAACLQDLVTQRVSLRPLRERLSLDIDFGVLRLTLAHLTRLSEQGTKHHCVT